MTDIPEISPDNRFFKIYADDNMDALQRKDLVRGLISESNPDHKNARAEFIAFITFMEAQRRELEETFSPPAAAKNTKLKTRPRGPAPR